MGMRDGVIDGKALLRICILTILLTWIGGFVLWDYARVVGDFTELKTPCFGKLDTRRSLGAKHLWFGFQAKML